MSLCSYEIYWGENRDNQPTPKASLYSNVSPACVGGPRKKKGSWVDPSVSIILQWEAWSKLMHALTTATRHQLKLREMRQNLIIYYAVTASNMRVKMVLPHALSSWLDAAQSEAAPHRGGQTLLRASLHRWSRAAGCWCQGGWGATPSAPSSGSEWQRPKETNG